MIVTVVLIAAAFIIAAIVTAIVIAARRARAPVSVVAPPPHVVGPARPYMEPLAESAYRDPAEPTIIAVEPAPAPPPLFDRESEPVSVSLQSPPALELVPSEPAVLPQIGWSKQFDQRSGALDDTARLRLIGDLGVVATEWCVPLLCQAYEEERRPANRQAALIALAACRSRAAMPTYRRALAADDHAERSIAADALADLEPPPIAKTRTTVERR